MSGSVQQVLDFGIPMCDLYPTVEAVRAGDEIEGIGGRAFPRPITVLGVEPHDGVFRLIYSRKRGGELAYGTVDVPAGTSVDLTPPF